MNSYNTPVPLHVALREAQINMIICDIFVTSVRHTVDGTRLLVTVEGERCGEVFVRHQEFDLEPAKVVHLKTWFKQPRCQKWPAH